MFLLFNAVLKLKFEVFGLPSMVLKKPECAKENSAPSKDPACAEFTIKRL